MSRPVSPDPIATPARRARRAQVDAARMTATCPKPNRARKRCASRVLAGDVASRWVESFSSARLELLDRRDRAASQVDRADNLLLHARNQQLFRRFARDPGDRSCSLHDLRGEQEALGDMALGGVVAVALAGRLLPEVDESVGVLRGSDADRGRGS